MSTAIAEAPRRELTIRDRLKDPAMIAEFGKAMPAHCKPERMARVALTAITRTPALADCEQASFFKAMLELSQWGLEPDGRRAHLIPFRNNKRGVTEVQLIIDWKGLAELVYRAGIVTKLHADVVHEGDLFEFNMGQVERHVPWFVRRDADKPATEGKVFAAYAQATLVGGLSKAEVLSREEVEAVRKRSRAGNNGPWVTDWNEMAKKTAFRRLSKWLPLSADLRDAMDRDDDRFEPIATVKQPAKSISDISALIVEGERYDHTDDESQEVADDEPVIESSGGGASGLEPEKAELLSPVQSQDSPAAAPSKPPMNRRYMEGEFIEAKTIAAIDDLSVQFLQSANVLDATWIREVAEANKQRIREAKKKA